MSQGEEMGSKVAQQPPLFYSQSTKGEQLAQGENYLVSIKQVFQVQDSGMSPGRKTLEKDGAFADVSQLNEETEFRIFFGNGIYVYQKTYMMADRFLPHRL